MLEFPRRARIAPPPEARPLPAWRAELNEKVKAIRANRSASAASAAQVLVEDQLKSEPELSPIVRKDETRHVYARENLAQTVSNRIESAQPAASTVTATRRSSNTIVEAALVRVKRATENASRAALPKIEPRPIQSSALSVTIDKQATARALEPAPEVEVAVEITPEALPDPVQPFATTSNTVEAEPEHIVKTVATPEATAEATAVAPVPVALVQETTDLSSLPVIDDLEPLDYLEAEIRKVDKALGAEFKKNESPSVFTHAVIGIVDLLAVAVSCSPFLAFIRIADGSFTLTQTRIASAVIVGLISFFYLALTQCLSGKTFGMMLTNTRIVDATVFETPSPSQSLVRTAGYFVAAAPALLGLLWAVLDRKHRGWHDYVSGTMVVRDF